MHALSRWLVGLIASPIGVLVLGVLDSTPFNWLPLGIDTAVVLLAARYGKLAWIAALLATLGSVCGAAMTFWLGAKAGEKGLARYIGSRRLRKVTERVRRMGAIPLAVLDLIPPPFPFAAVVLAAGALGVDRTTFFVTLTVCRLFRFGLEALLGANYGRQIVGWLNSDIFHEVVAGLIALAVVAAMVSIVRLIRGTRPARRRAAA